MKNRLIITVSDVHGTRAFNVHQIAKKIIILSIVFVLVVIGGGSWFIKDLANRYSDLKIQKEKELEKKTQYIEKKDKELFILSEKEKRLLAQNKFYSMQIKGKVEDIEALSSKLDDIETMIGLKSEKEEREEITKKTLNSISEKMKMYILLTVPNGAPLSHTRITSPFGYRIHPITKKRQFHRGIDLKAKRRTPVYATADGVVSFVQSKFRSGGYGRVIKIEHNFGFQTIYGHLYRTEVKAGDIVRKNQEIGLSGNSGRSTAPHLHYEVRYGGKILNPKDFLNWDLRNFNKIFTKQRRVKWESLVKLINEQQKTVQR